MNKKENKFSRTDVLIIKSFIKLAERRPLDNIKVGEICQEAMIRRATFYNHFEGKEHLMHATVDLIIEDLSDSIIKHIDTLPIADIANHIMQNIVKFFSENKTSIEKVISMNAKFTEYNHIITRSISNAIKHFFIICKDKIVYDLPIDILSSFFSGGIANMIVDWINNENNYTAEELSEMCNVISEKIKKMLQLNS